MWYTVGQYVVSLVVSFSSDTTTTEPRQGAGGTVRTAGRWEQWAQWEQWGKFLTQSEPLAPDFQLGKIALSITHPVTDPHKLTQDTTRTPQEHHRNTTGYSDTVHNTTYHLPPTT